MGINSPKVSVIIPTYNRAIHIGRAVESIFTQTYQDFEIIIIDDGSTDNTKDVLFGYHDRIKYIYQTNKGVSSARNRGIKEARGEYLAFLDSDDIWLPTKLEKQIKLFHKDPTIYLVYSYARYFDRDNNSDFIRPQHISKSFEDFLYAETVLPTSSVMLRKEAIDKVGLFDEQLPSIEDYDLWLRISQKFKVDFISEILVEKNNYPGNLSNNRVKMYVGQVGVCKNILTRFEKEIDKKKILEKEAKNHYLLAKEYYAQFLYKKAKDQLLAAIKIKSTIGKVFWCSRENIISKFIKLVKPYLFYLLLALRSKNEK